MVHLDSGTNGLEFMTGDKMSVVEGKAQMGLTTKWLSPRANAHTAKISAVFASYRRFTHSLMILPITRITPEFSGL